MRRVVAAVIAVAAMLLLAACNIVTHVVVHPDGSGTYSLVLTAPPGAAGGDPGPAIVAQLKKATAKSDVPLTVTPYQVSGESGARATFTFRSLPDLKAESARLAAVGSGLNAVTVERTSAGWSFSSATVPGLTVPPVGTKPTGGLITATPLTGLIHVSVIVELPGAPAENNATAVTHNATTSTFDWVVPVGKAGTALQASTTFVGNQSSVKLATATTKLGGGHGTSSDSSNVWWIVGGAVVLALLLAAGLFLGLRRRRAPAARHAPTEDDTTVDEPTEDEPEQN